MNLWSIIPFLPWKIDRQTHRFVGFFFVFLLQGRECGWWRSSSRRGRCSTWTTSAGTRRCSATRAPPFDSTPSSSARTTFAPTLVSTRAPFFKFRHRRPSSRFCVQSGLFFTFLLLLLPFFFAVKGATRTADATELLYARQRLVAVAKAWRLQAVDLVHTDIGDAAGLQRQSAEGSRMGFTGKQVRWRQQRSPISLVVSHLWSVASMRTLSSLIVPTSGRLRRWSIRRRSRRSRRRSRRAASTSTGRVSWSTPSSGTRRRAPAPSPSAATWSTGRCSSRLVFSSRFVSSFFSLVFCFSILIHCKYSWCLDVLDESLRLDLFYIDMEGTVEDTFNDRVREHLVEYKCWKSGLKFI